MTAYVVMKCVIHEQNYVHSIYLDKYLAEQAVRLLNEKCGACFFDYQEMPVQTYVDPEKL